jgi:hypothetical protein
LTLQNFIALPHHLTGGRQRGFREEQTKKKAVIKTEAAKKLIINKVYSYRLIGKLTAFLQLEEFSLRRHTQVASSPSATRLSSRSYRGK